MTRVVERSDWNTDTQRESCGNTKVCSHLHTREVLEETIPDNTFNSDGSPPEQQENKCPLFKPPVYCILLWQPEKTATGFEMLRTLDDMAS